MIAEAAFASLNRMTGVAPLRGPRFLNADPIVPAPFRVAAAAAAALSLTAACAAEIRRLGGGAAQEMEIDLRAAAATLVGFALLTLDGKAVPRPAESNPTVGLYRAACGRFIHLQGGFPHLAERTLALLNASNDAASIAAAVAKWDGLALEDALAHMSQCGALVRTREQWAASPQGQALAQTPPLVLRRIGDAPRLELSERDAPLAGLRVLDLTRVLAGPAAGRTLASHGAEVLAIRSPALPTIDLFDLETGIGKRCAFLDLKRPAEAEQLRQLARQADVFVESYRPGGLARLGFSAEALALLSPGIVHVAISCYGHHGPWAARPGWEQMAQAATGIAFEQGAFLARRDKKKNGPPALIGAAACDFITGYLAAAGAAAALLRRMREGGSWKVEVSLAATAQWLLALGIEPDAAIPAAWDPAAGMDAYRQTWQTGRGPLSALGPVMRMAETPPAWQRPPPELGADRPTWL